MRPDMCPVIGMNVFEFTFLFGERHAKNMNDIRTLHGGERFSGHSIIISNAIIIFFFALRSGRLRWFIITYRKNFGLSKS